MKNWLSLTLALLLSACGASNEHQLHSPDGDLTLTLSESERGKMVYSLSRDGKTVLKESPLGLVLNDAPFDSGLMVTDVSKPRPVESHYTLVQGKQREMHYRARERVVQVENAAGDQLGVVFRLSNDGLAFQYRIPARDGATRRVERELTGFAFPAESKAWLQPLAVAQTGYKNTNPSYEEHYQMGIDVGTPGPTEAGWAFPSLFKTPGGWALITEAGMDGRYHASRLASKSPGGLYRIAPPMKPEVTTGGDRLANADEAFTSPWRIIAVGDLATVTESTLGTDLAEPAVAEMDWVEPGFSAWSWALLKDESVNPQTTREFIDYAADMSWPYVLIDASWDQKIGWETLAELSDYAADKDVDLMVWYNSSGAWNETVYTPKTQLVERDSRREHFARLQSLGIKGVKIDFFPGDGQSVMQYYNDLAKDAADFELVLNYHGSSLPRGLHRTYPNLLTMESVHGFEMITFMQNSADKAPAHMAMLPFTRNVFDPMDFTPTTFGEIPNIERRTTNGFELALPVLFTSGLQHIAETAEGMSRVPDTVKNYMRDIPVLWDESRLLSGFPGRDVVMARRRGDEWHIVGINGEDKAKTLSVDLTFLDGREGTLITDGDQLRSFQKRAVSGGQVIELPVRAAGGFVIKFSEN